MANGETLDSARKPVPPLPMADGRVEKPERSPSGNWYQQAQRLRTEAEVFYLAFKSPRTPWYARLIAVCAASYLLSPVQLIPSYIPFIGFLDDFLVLFLGVKLLRKAIPRDVLAECRRRAEALEAGRKAEIRSRATTVGAVMIVSFWLLATVITSVLIVKYIRH
jgi:uncharacterized membrane protein YkvA (DUF1232 family)